MGQPNGFPLLADDIGVGTGTIRDWLRGKSPFTLDHPAWTDIDRALARQTERFSKAVSEALLDAGVDFAKTRHSQSAVVETLVQSLAKRGFRIVRI